MSTGRIILVGPIADPGKPAVGGYESANLRVLSLLQRICPGATAYAYPRTAGSPVRKAMQYAGGFTNLLWKLGSRDGRNTAIHFTPLCRHFLAAETLLALAARSRGSRLTLDLRAGMQQSWYESSSPLYRWCFRRLLSLATTITYEGEAYAPWLHSLAPSSRRIWFPNFVPRMMVRQRLRDPLPAAPRFVCLGAVSEAKGAEASLRVFRSLKQTMPCAMLALIGRCDPEYEATLERMGLLGEGVDLTGPLVPAAVEKHLDDAHFFLFLSHWFGEGHSNALTEAMARGCVPFASRHGFNASVVACDELIVNDRNATEAIATRILSIWQSDNWLKFSDAMVDRVTENFTDVQGLHTLQTIYAGVMETSVHNTATPGTPSLRAEKS